MSVTLPDIYFFWGFGSPNRDFCDPAKDDRTVFYFSEHHLISIRGLPNWEFRDPTNIHYFTEHHVMSEPLEWRFLGVA